MGTMVGLVLVVGSSAQVPVRILVVSAIWTLTLQ